MLVKSLCVVCESLVVLVLKLALAHRLLLTLAVALSSPHTAMLHVQSYIETMVIQFEMTFEFTAYLYMVQRPCESEMTLWQNGRAVSGKTQCHSCSHQIHSLLLLLW